MRHGLGALLATGLIGLLGAGSAGAADQSVDLELVLAVDVSGSMDRGEQMLQRDGYVAAITHPDVVRAIQTGFTGGIALTYVEWAGAGAQSITVPWRHIVDQDSASAFAAELDEAPFARIRGTSISSGLRFAAGLFDGNGFDGLRRVIDISGDGPNNMGPPVVPIRDEIVASGIIINGLPIMLDPSGSGFMNIPNLDAYYEFCVIGGPGAFMIAVDAPEQLADAIRRKLVLEIAGAAAIRPAAALLPAAAEDFDCMIGEQRWRSWMREP